MGNQLTIIYIKKHLLIFVGHCNTLPSLLGAQVTSLGEIFTDRASKFKGLLNHSVECGDLLNQSIVKPVTSILLLIKKATPPLRFSVLSFLIGPKVPKEKCWLGFKWVSLTAITWVTLLILSGLTWTILRLFIF